jgi:hypothetical protein
MTTDPLALLALAAVAWAVFAIQTWRRRPRKQPTPDAQPETATTTTH